MSTDLLIGLLFSFLEKISFLIFPLVFFRYSIQKRIVAIFLISIVLTLSTNFIRQFTNINVSYSVFIGMLVSYLLVVLILKVKPIPAITIISIGYIANTTIQVIILILLVVTTDQTLTQVTNQFHYQVLIYTTTFFVMIIGSYSIKKFGWQISLEQPENTHLSKQINIFIGLFSLVGLVMVVQTITVFFSIDENIFQSILLILGTVGLFLILFLIIRNIKLSQKHAKVEEDKHYLQTITTYSSEIKQNIQDYKSQLEVLQQLARYQDPMIYKRYLNELITEREFMMKTVEISEPMLSSFLQKEWHVCKAADVNLKIDSCGYYLPPAFISGYNLNRILKQIIDQFVNQLQEKSKHRNINLCVDATDSQQIKFIINTNMLCNVDPNILEKIEIYNGTPCLQTLENKQQTILTLHFSRY